MNNEQIALDYIKELREKGEWHNWIIDNQNEYIVSLAECCELAHEYTKLECEKLGISEIDDIDENGNTTYTAQAQEIFNAHYDLITNTFSI